MTTIKDLNDLKKLGCVDPWIFAGLDQEESQLTMEKIELIVCSSMMIEPAALKKKSRLHELVLTRQLVYYFCNKYIINSFNITLTTVAGRYGQNHATVCHAAKTIKNILDIHVDALLCEKIGEMELKIKSYTISSRRTKIESNGK